MKNKINVTSPFLPPLEEFQEYLEKIWDSKWITNNGKYHRQFEKELTEFLSIKYISLFANGTLNDGLITKKLKNIMKKEILSLKIG